MHFATDGKLVSSTAQQNKTSTLAKLTKAERCARNKLPLGY